MVSFFSTVHLSYTGIKNIIIYFFLPVSPLPKWLTFSRPFLAQFITTIYNSLVIEKTSKYFNLLTRFSYMFSFLSKIPLKGRSLFYQLIVRLEPYIKYGAEEHIIVAKKVDL